MKMLLKDGAPRCKGEVELNIRKDANTVEIGASGVDPAPVVIEYYEGKLRLRVYAEGNAVSPVYSVELNSPEWRIEKQKDFPVGSHSTPDGRVFIPDPGTVGFGTHASVASSQPAQAVGRGPEQDDVSDGEAMTIGTPSGLLNQDAEDDDLSGY